MKNNLSIRSVYLSIDVISLLFVACNNHEAGANEVGATYILEVPNYDDDEMWYVRENDELADRAKSADVFYLVSTWETDWETDDGRVCHYADVYNADHRADMDKEISSIADYMGEVGDFHSCEPWLYKECLRKNFHARVEAF